MAHYEQIGRKSVVNSCLGSRKANKINGLLVQGPHRRDGANENRMLYDGLLWFIIANTFHRS